MSSPDKYTALGDAPEAWRRHLDLLVAGMRPTDTALAHPPLSQEQVDRIVSKRATSSISSSEGIR